MTEHDPMAALDDAGAVPSGYYLTRAATALREAGAPTADPTEIATWAQETARTDRRARAGIVVDQQGRILAETRRHGRDVQAWYVVRLADGIDQRWVLDTEVSLAMGGIRQQTGRPVIHLSWWDVGSGHVWPADLRRDQERVERAQAALEEARAARDVTVREALGEITPGEVREATGLSRQRINQIQRAADTRDVEEPPY